jgi:hypothetical protein
MPHIPNGKSIQIMSAIPFTIPLMRTKTPNTMPIILNTWGQVVFIFVYCELALIPNKQYCAAIRVNPIECTVDTNLCSTKSFDPSCPLSFIHTLASGRTAIVLPHLLTPSTLLYLRTLSLIHPHLPIPGSLSSHRSQHQNGRQLLFFRRRRDCESLHLYRALESTPNIPFY